MSGRRSLLTAAAVVLALTLVGCNGDEEASDDASPTDAATDAGGGDDASASAPQGPPGVSFVNPVDGDTVSSPVTVVAHVEGLDLAPAGDAVQGQGHLHLIVDAGCVATGTEIPADGRHVHLDDGSSSTVLELRRGQRRLCLQAADGLHRALAFRDEITVTVQ